MKGERLPLMPQLDGLRALAVLAVLYTHFVSEQYWLFGIYWGALGLRLFFVLSGFLITSLILREKPPFRTAYVAFLLRRALRLYPILLITLSVAAVLNLTAVRETFFWHAAYLTNFYVAMSDTWPGSTSHLWSLAVEAQFYLLWPFVLFFLPRRYLTATMVFLILGSLAFRLLWGSLEISHLGGWVLPIGCFDALALGSLLAISRKWVMPVGIAGLLIWLTTNEAWFGWGLWNTQISITGAAMFFALVVSLAARGVAWSGLNNAILQYVGTISYGIYVLHLPVWHYIGHKSALLALCLTMGLAAFSWHVLEQPIIRYGRKFTLRGQTVIAPHLAAPRGAAYKRLQSHK